MTDEEDMYDLRDMGLIQKLQWIADYGDKQFEEVILEAISKIKNTSTKDEWVFDMNSTPNKSDEYLGWIGLWGYNYPDDTSPTYGVSLLSYDFISDEWEKLDEDTPDILCFIGWKPIGINISNKDIFEIIERNDKIK